MGLLRYYLAVGKLEKQLVEMRQVRVDLALINFCTDSSGQGNV